MKPEKLDPMNTELTTEPNKTAFLQTVVAALGNLKQQLQHDYEQAYPDLREIIHLVLDEEESRAWDLTLFPHLLLPDLVEAHVARLNLRPAETKHADGFATHGHDRFQNQQPIFALCG
jgi:hypothetical protein